MMATEYHIPVMLSESIGFLRTDPDGIYIDATLGAGGHTIGLLKELGENATVFGLDQDDEALAEATANVGGDSRFKTIKGNFGYLETLLDPEYHGKVSGILLDLGVSSHQIDDPGRGFSFREDGPLDMRMGNLRATTAADVLNNYTEHELRRILYVYGEERFAPAITRRIIENRPIESTSQLRDCVEAVVHPPKTVKSLARVFQAIRIEVNKELEMLRRVLDQSTRLLKPGGRIVVISYHSLEDRIVKNWFKAGNEEGEQEKDFYGNVIRPFDPVVNKVVMATEKEKSENPRSRSARLRAAEKTEETP